jgi:hypothetical protein
MNGFLSRLPAACLVFALGLSLTGCPTDEVLEACTKLCAQRAACDKENGNSSETNTGNCQTACVATHGDDFVQKSNECEEKSSCDYVSCADP